MRIGINCITVDPDYAGGVSNYTFGLLGGFVGAGSAHQFTIFTSEKNKHLFERFITSNISLQVLTGYDHLWQRRILWQFVKIKSKLLYGAFSRIFYRGLSRQLSSSVDVLYTPTTILFPIYFEPSFVTVLSMHDVQQSHFPQFFTPMELKDRYVTYTLSAENATYIQASSGFIKNDLLDKFRFLKEKQMVVIPEGVNIQLFAASKGKGEYVIGKYNLPQQFLFYPAQLWPHKDHITVLKALLRLKEKGIIIPLALTGAKYSAADPVFKFINENGLDKQVFHLGKIPYEDIVALYRHARFLVSASLHESNCLTVLEAAASGTPVIVSDIPPNIELQEHLQLNIFPQQNDEALAALINKVWDDTQLQQQQADHNKRHIERYSWENVAKQYLSFFETVNPSR